MAHRLGYHLKQVDSNPRSIFFTVIHSFVAVRMGASTVRNSRRN